MEQFRSKHKQTQSEWEAEMSKKVLEFVRSELYMDLRFLDIALGTLVYRADENIRSFADLPDGHSVGWKDAFEKGFEIFYKYGVREAVNNGRRKKASRCWKSNQRYARLFLVEQQYLL